MKKLISYKCSNGGIGLEYKKQDLWVGIFYKNGKKGQIDVWICILPCFPIHYWYGRERVIDRI
ncbi:hypothetical protein KAR91_55595 [Candidatus Pacearchaeota archaeon]|nr:hypothetical protein [Candidatus Pacearchaeota archaeon]